MGLQGLACLKAVAAWSFDVLRRRAATPRHQHAYAKALSCCLTFVVLRCAITTSPGACTITATVAAVAVCMAAQYCHSWLTVPLHDL